VSELKGRESVIVLFSFPDRCHSSSCVLGDPPTLVTSQVRGKTQETRSVKPGGGRGVGGVSDLRDLRSPAHPKYLCQVSRGREGGVGPGLSEDWAKGVRSGG
jgi:hypothetical protein